MSWRLPAEWEPQECVWFVWPRDPLTWPDRVDAVRDVFVQAMEAVAPQPVRLAVHPDLAHDVEARLAGLDHVTVHPVVHQDSWIRDYGALTLVDDGARRCLDFRFDAWGEKYEALMPDDEVTTRLAEQGGWPAATERIDAVLEGGAVETDGQGTFLATRSVAAARGQSEEEHEALLRDHLGAKTIVWLDEGIEGDDTDGHIDTIARFVAPGKVVCARAPADHPDHAVLEADHEALLSATDARGRALEVIDLPVPPAQSTDVGDVLPAGHANFLITDPAVLVPTYGGDSDAAALRLLEELLPGRDVVGLDHRALIWGFGGIHCLSMQVPRA